MTELSERPVEVMVGLVPTKYPPPHARYLVVRDGVTCTATPCYGMHQPWWVVRTFVEDARPVAMQPGDEWRELKPNAQVEGPFGPKEKSNG